MSISLELVNNDEEFRQLQREPIIVNDFKTDTQEEKDLILGKIMTKYNSDVMDSVPRCDCGVIHGAERKDVYCKDCLSYCTHRLEDKIESILWARVPDGVTAFINPMVWTMLTKFFKKGGFDVIQWLTNTNYLPKCKEPVEVKILVSQGVKRGYNNFVNNFDQILTVMFNLNSYKKKQIRDELVNFLYTFKDKIFSQHMPFPNRTLLVIENTDYDRYAEPVIFSAIDAINTITSIDCSIIKPKLWVRENRTAKTIAAVAEFTEQYFRNHIAKKPGLLRQHFYGSRANHSFRGVITSLTRKHVYDELHIPWSIAMGAFRTFLQNKLEGRGYTLNQSNEKMNRHAALYDSELADIFNELIDESKEKGIVVTFCRNPTLGMGSIQRLRITHVKPDVNDPTISMSILIVTGFNADFDGDALAGQLMLDNNMAEMSKSLAPHRNILDPNTPRRINNHPSLPKTVVSNAGNWFKTLITNQPTDAMRKYAI